MGWKEQAVKECPDCNGRGGWSHRHRVTGEHFIDRCGRCKGYGRIEWGADPGPACGEGPPLPDNWLDSI